MHDSDHLIDPPPSPVAPGVVAAECSPVASSGSVHPTLTLSLPRHSARLQAQHLPIDTMAPSLVAEGVYSSLDQQPVEELPSDTLSDVSNLSDLTEPSNGDAHTDRSIQGVTTSFHVHADNTAAIILSKTFTNHSRTKHIDVRYHIIHGHITWGSFSPEWVPTHENVADALTKPLAKSAFTQHHILLSVVSR